MEDPARRPFVTTVDRDSLADALIGRRTARGATGRSLFAVTEVPLKPQQVLVGYWGSDNDDPFPEFLVIRDEDVPDTYAWLSAYLSGLAPITQWCRVWSAAQFGELMNAPARPALDGRTGPWVGAIMAECVAQARMQLNLKMLSGASAASSASFAAARARAVWGNFHDFGDLAKRHDALSDRLRARQRPIPAARLASLWHVLAGEGWAGREPAEARTLGVFREVFELGWSEEISASDRAAAAVQRVTDAFDLPDLLACASGPQRERVEGLDRLGERLRVGPKSAAIDAILGFGASLVEPGAAVMPELLRRFETAMPTAQVWAGAFAGLWAPVRVMSEHGGLGRLIAKALLRESDLFARPAADIGFDELVRWLPAGRGDRMPLLRGMNPRVVEVELAPGVTAPFQLRSDPVRTETSGSPAVNAGRQRALELEGAEATRPVAPSAVELAALVDALAQRIKVLEQAGESKAGATRSRVRKPKT
ncbi:hypothetical protein [Sphingomonas sp.]|uniref:hypothetical protein n=1 Tax=Sphingomonas sp. TaxID=28214 RepID=UPI003AFF668C